MIVVIGVGNPYRRDDGVGPAVIDRLRARDLPGVQLMVSDGEATGLIEAWDGARLAIVVDAVRAEPAHPGRVHRLCVHRPPAERGRAASSHGMDMGEAVELARLLGRLPDRLVLYAVEAADVGFGTGLSTPVAAAADRLTDRIADEVAAETRPETRPVAGAGKER